MLRKALTLGMVFIFALSLLAVSMITCFTYDAEAHGNGHAHWRCWHDPDHNFWAGEFHNDQPNLHCCWQTQ